MKAFITRKEIYNTHKAVYCVSACAFDSLFRYLKPYAYNSGVYGWNYDVYSIDTIAITTGYRAIGKLIPCDVIKRYENKAKEIIAKSPCPWTNEKTKADISNLVNDLVNELIGGTK